MEKNPGMSVTGGCIKIKTAGTPSPHPCKLFEKSLTKTLILDFYG